MHSAHPPPSLQSYTAAIKLQEHTPTAEATTLRELTFLASTLAVDLAVAEQKNLPFLVLRWL